MSNKGRKPFQKEKYLELHKMGVTFEEILRIIQDDCEQNEAEAYGEGLRDW